MDMIVSPVGQPAGNGLAGFSFLRICHSLRYPETVKKILFIWSQSGYTVIAFCDKNHSTFFKNSSMCRSNFSPSYKCINTKEKNQIGSNSHLRFCIASEGPLKTNPVHIHLIKRKFSISELTVGSFHKLLIILQANHPGNPCHLKSGERFWCHHCSQYPEQKVLISP